MMIRVTNSSVKIDKTRSNYNKLLGFINSSNITKTVKAPEFTYTFSTNSLGFRTGGIISKRKGEKRVLLIGDSMFWGVGCNKGNLIDDFIEDADRNYRVYNFSTVGFNTLQELLVAENYIDTLQPDHVILGFFIANDIIPNMIEYVDSSGNYSSSEENTSVLRNDIEDYLGILKYSNIFRIISIPVFTPRIRYELCARDSYLGNSFELLKEFKTLCDLKKVRFSVLIIYPCDAVVGGLLAWWSKSKSVGNKIYRFCGDNGIDAVRTIDFMEGSKDRDEYFYAKDKHPNAEGNKKIASIIYNEFLKD